MSIHTTVQVGECEVRADQFGANSPHVFVDLVLTARGNRDPECGADPTVVLSFKDLDEVDQLQDGLDTVRRYFAERERAGGLEVVGP